MLFIRVGTGVGMSAKKWTAPGPLDQSSPEAADARKGTAAANPVLSLSPDRRPAPRRASGATSGEHDAEHAPDTRSAAEIEADIEQTRDRLAGTLDELTERLSPRTALRKANTAARGAFVTPEGSVRKDRAAVVLGTLAAVVAGAVALRKRHRD
jgi:hypothetical protein